MTEKLDPEQVKEITRRIFSGIKKVVAKYEGFIERVIGDGLSLSLVFTTPMRTIRVAPPSRS